MVGPKVAVKADLTLEEDPFGARSSSPLKDSGVVGVGAGGGREDDEEDSFSSDEDSSDGEEAEHVVSVGA